MSKDKNDEIAEEQAPKVQNSQFDVVGLLLDFLSNWKWFLLSVVLCGAISYYYYSTIIPIYNVSASIYLSDEKGATRSQVMLGMMDPMNEQMAQSIDETEIEILRSKNNLMKIVDSLDLAYSYYTVGKLRDIPVYRNSPVLVSLDSVSLRTLSAPITVMIDKNDDGYTIITESFYGGAKERYVTPVKKLPVRLKLSQGILTVRESPITKKMNGTEKVVILNPSTVAGSLSGRLRIEFAKNSTQILNLSLDTKTIEEGRDILKVLIDFYNQQIIEDKNRSAIQTEAFILDRLMMISGELRDVEDRLRAYREANNISDLAAQTTMNLSQRSSSEQELASVEAERELLNDLESTVVHQDSYKMLPAVSNNEALTGSIKEYNNAVSNYENAMKSMGSDHPHIEKMQEDLNRQKSQIISNINAAKNEVRARRRSIASVEGRSAGQLSMQPTIDKGLNEIFREQQVKVNIYTFLLQKREEIALEKTLATPTAQFIDNPTGWGPISPRRDAYLGYGLLIGLLIPALIITLKRFLFPKFNDKEELERLTKVPILGEICLNDGSGPVAIGESVSTPIAELFRLLRNNISFTRGTGEKKVILVTSSVSGEGKTFIALNLAMTYALTGKRVVVVGLDIRRPVLAHICGLTNATGVTTFLSGQESQVDSLITESSFNPNLFILPAGPVPPNPNELLLNDNATQMFNQLRAKFDYVIIDSAPIGLVSDTLLIAPHSDVQLYVTRANYSTAKGLKVLHDAINSNRLPHAYIVLNGVNVGSTAYIYRRYGYYGYYSKNSYGYAYGYGEGEGHQHHHHHHRKQPFYKKLVRKLTGK